MTDSPWKLMDERWAMALWGEQFGGKGRAQNPVVAGSQIWYFDKNGNLAKAQR
ncbi:hypothetical protein L0337_07950 [candidate division KSB1 bacterium]|nr:hypothetical protein [candidate division KSB1 bacterium]